MSNWFKKLFIPSGEKVVVTAYKSWVVRWHAATNPYSWVSFYNKEEMEIFPSEEDARAFAQQLKEAFRLSRSSDLARLVKVQENESKLASMSV